MAKYKAPENCDGISVGGEYFEVGEDGCITVPDEGDYGALILPHGFTPAADKPARSKKAPADATAADKPAETGDQPQA